MNFRILHLITVSTLLCGLAGILLKFVGYISTPALIQGFTQILGTVFLLVFFIMIWAVPLLWIFSILFFKSTRQTSWQYLIRSVLIYAISLFVMILIWLDTYAKDEGSQELLPFQLL